MKYPVVKEFARDLRKNQTDAEKIFWNAVRNRRLHGFKFTRQFIIEYKYDSKASKYFIVDFYCHEKKLVVEIDGGYHKYQMSVDKERDEIINSYGLKVVRFTNEEVLNDFKAVRVNLELQLKSNNLKGKRY